MNPITVSTSANSPSLSPTASHANPHGLPTITLRLLGGFHLDRNDSPATPALTMRMQSLVAFLILHREAPQPRHYLAFQLWPDSTEQHARANLRKLLFELRVVFPLVDTLLHIDRQHLMWRPDVTKVHLTLDVVTFEQFALHHENVPDLERAAALYRGDLLPEVYDDWIGPHREHLRQIYEATLERLITLLEARYDYVAALHYAEHLCQHDPLCETTYQTLMRLHARQGNHAGVVTVYQNCQTVLQRELGAAPSPSTHATYVHLISSNASEPPATVALVNAENAQVSSALYHLSCTVTALGGTPQTDMSVLNAPIAEHLGDLLLQTMQYDQSRIAYRAAQLVLSERDMIGQARLIRKCGASFTAQHRFTDALKSYAAAAHTLGQFAEDAAPSALFWRREWIEIHLGQMWGHYFLAQPSAYTALSAHANPVINRSGSDWQRFQWFHYQAAIGNQRERYTPSSVTLGLCQTALTVAEASGESVAMAMALHGLGFTHLGRDEFQEAEKQFTAAIALAEHVGQARIAVQCHAYLSIVLRRQGHLAAAQQIATITAKKAQAGSLPAYAGIAQANLAWVAWRRGDLRRAEALGKAGLILMCQAVTSFPHTWLARFPLLAVALETDHLTVALEHAHAMLVPSQQRLPNALSAALDEALHSWERNQPDRAAHMLRQAVALARTAGYL